MGRGPTTRSRANAGSKATEDESDKEVTCQSVQPHISANPLVELPQVDDGNGSMAAFLAMRKGQQEAEKAEKEKTQKEKAEKEKIEKEKAVASASRKTISEFGASRQTVSESGLPDIEEGDEDGYLYILLLLFIYALCK